MKGRAFKLKDGLSNGTMVVRVEAHTSKVGVSRPRWQRKGSGKSFKVDNLGN